MYASTIITSLGLFFGLAAATVNVGFDSAGTPAAWIGGESECNHASIGQPGGDPCGIEFTLDNGQSFILTGCGGAGLSLENGDGSFNSNCEFVGNEVLQCGITEQWSCF